MESPRSMLQILQQFRRSYALTFFIVAIGALLIFLPGSAAAQNPDYILSLTDASGAPGELVDVQVMLDNNGDNIQGWSLGVTHDPAFVTLIEVEDGSTTSTVNGGGSPDFNQVNIYPDQGFTVALVISFTGLASLPGGTLNNELNIATYQLNATSAGSSSQLEFVDTIGSPPIETIVVVNGASVLPTTQAGTISIIDCTNTPAPPTNLTCSIETNTSCQCQALLEWQATPSQFGFYEIYVDGVLATTASSNATSVIISLPTSDPSAICIRSLCGSLFSPFVCCTVECNLDLDCNNNGIPDLCDLDQGALDCNSNGEIDECEIAAGFVPDCNANGIIDECEYSTASDCNSNGIIDACDLLYGVSEDCNLNNIPDECELDCDDNGIPDDCELITRDCNANGLIDICEINAGTTPDCNQNGTPDSCEYSAATDCNANGILDPCDILNGISEDCDNNDIPDECDIASGAADADGDGIPDACAGQNFLRGECNGDDSITIADAIFLLSFLFNGGSAPTCQDACDINDDSGIDIGDGVNLLAYLFNNGPNPQNPFPTCGVDPTKDQLGCENFGVCP